MITSFRSVEFTKLLIKLGYKEIATTKSQRMSRWVSPGTLVILRVSGLSIEIIYNSEKDSAYTVSRQANLLMRLKELLIQEVLDV